MISGHVTTVHQGSSSSEKEILKLATRKPKQQLTGGKGQKTKQQQKVKGKSQNTTTTKKVPKSGAAAKKEPKPSKHHQKQQQLQQQQQQQQSQFHQEGPSQTSDQSSVKQEHQDDLGSILEVSHLHPQQQVPGELLQQQLQSHTTFMLPLVPEPPPLATDTLMVHNVPMNAYLEQPGLPNHQIEQQQQQMFQIPASSLDLNQGHLQQQQQQHILQEHHHHHHHQQGPESVIVPLQDQMMIVEATVANNLNQELLNPVLDNQ